MSGPVTNTPAWASGSAAFSVYGGVTLTSGMTVSGANTMTMAARSAVSLTTAGIPLFQLTINGPSGTVSLADNLTIISTKIITLTNGTFNAVTFNVTLVGDGTQFSSSNSNVRTVGIGSGTWTLPRTDAGIVWVMATSTNASITGTGTIKVTGSGTGQNTFQGGGLTYPNLWIARGTATGGVNITGANTFTDIKDDGTGTHSNTFPNSTTTVTSFTVANTSNLTSLIRTGASGNWTLSCANAINTNYITPSNCIFTGGGTWHAGANSTDGGGNTGITFP